MSKTVGIIGLGLLGGSLAKALKAYTDYEGMMELTESMFRYLAEKVCGSTKISYNGIEIDFGKPFERLTMNDAIKKYAGIDFDAVETDEEAKQLAKEHHIEFENRHTKGDIINLFFEEYCEKELIQPTFITEYPAEVSPLARRNDVNPEITDRFEFFIGGREIGNGFSELNDAEDQAQRFQDQVDAKAAGDDEAMFYDEDYVTALEHGLPPTAGLGIGIDRMVMLFTNSHTIRDVILFPAMRPQK